MSTPLKLSTVGLLVPPEFPLEAYEGIHAAVSQRSPLNEHYAGAWNGVAYRYLAMVEYSGAFAASITQPGTSLGRHNQERDLFGFFTNGLATLESAFYGTFAIGYLVKPSEFPLATAEDQQRVTPRSTQKGFIRAFPGDRVLTTLNAVLGSDAYTDLAGIRNILAHRAAPGRQIYLGTTEVQPDEWKLHGRSIVLEPGTTKTRQANLTRLLTVLLEGVRDFVARRL